MVKILEEHNINSVLIKNRIIMEPMCMYSVTTNDGIPNNFHYAHYLSHALGKVGLIIIEATGITAEGRISDQCLGLWNDAQKDAFKNIVDGIHEQGGKAIIQLNHAGRKCTATHNVGKIYAPSPLPFDDQSTIPHALSKDEIQNVIQSFVHSAKLALEAGFDGIEIHAAHGYLLSQFMSPVSNQRTDNYNDGSLFLTELTVALKEFWPTDKILSIRLSTNDYTESGLDVDKTIEQIKHIAKDYDLINVSTGGIAPLAPPALYPGYQVNDAIAIKQQLGATVVACGMLGDPDLATFLIEANHVDYIGLARPLLKNPNWPLELYAKHNLKNLITRQYQRGF